MKRKIEHQRLCGNVERAIYNTKCISQKKEKKNPQINYLSSNIKNLEKSKINPKQTKKYREMRAEINDIKNRK